MIAASSIIFVHGLQGHPYKTWASIKSSTTISSTIDTQAGIATANRLGRDASSFTGTFRRMLAKGLTGDPTLSKHVADGPSLIQDLDDSASTLSPPPRASNSSAVYWPGDLLPSECPQARILVWGYDTVITKKLSDSIACKRSPLCARARAASWLSRRLGGAFTWRDRRQRSELGC